MDALRNRARRAFERRMSETCIVRQASPDAADPDEPYTDSEPMPCRYVPASTTEVLTAAGVSLSAQAHLELPAERFGQVHADDRVRLTGSKDPVLAGRIRTLQSERRPMEFAVDGEPETPLNVLIVKVRA